MNKKLTFVLNMKGKEYVEQTRAYLDYMEKHLNNIALAFEEVTKACDGMVWVGDDGSWFSIRNNIENHDLSKFSKEEFVQYRQKFFPVNSEVINKQDWKNAWRHHQKSNHHHWQSLRYDKKYPGQTEHDVVEMVIDWTAMSYEFGGSAESYYNKNKKAIHIDPRFEQFLQEIFTRISNSKYQHKKYSKLETLINKLKKCWPILVSKNG